MINTTSNDLLNWKNRNYLYFYLIYCCLYNVFTLYSTVFAFLCIQKREKWSCLTTCSCLGAEYLGRGFQRKLLKLIYKMGLIIITGIICQLGKIRGLMPLQLIQAALEADYTLIEFW